MDKSTLSQYGWATIVIIIIVILLGFATPFGNYISDNVIATLDSFSDAAGIDVVFGDSDFNGGTLGAVTNYTAEEIETNEHLCAIGRTKPEYVVAEFNNDFSEVTITKNGENSDGLMMDWIDMDTGEFLVSPMAIHGDTLEVMTIKDGVKNIGCGIMTNIEAFAIASSWDLSKLSVEEVQKYNVRVIEENGYLNFGTWKLHTLNIEGSSVTEIGAAAFACCNNLNNITLNDRVANIGALAFFLAGCKNLSKMPANLEVVENASFMFSGIEHLEFGDKITTLLGQAFQFCIYISNDVVLPASLSNIGNDGIGRVFVGSNIDTFYGTSGSYAENWAIENGYTFVAI